MKHIEIELLRLANFRNYNKLDIGIKSGFNVITGLNGAGKTTILDAIYYLCNGKSYFTHLDKHIYKTGTNFFRLEGHYQKGNRKHLSVIKSSITTKKSIELNEKKLKSLSELMGHIPAFIIAPKDILILIDSSIERRKVTDRTISHSDKTYLLHLLNYNKLLKQRNAYLKDINKKGLSDSVFLESLNEGLIVPAKYIHQSRIQYVKDIGPIVNKVYADISGQSEEITISYKSQLNETSLRELLDVNLRKDMALAKTSAGIHRDDLEIFIEGKPIKKYASQGQLKSAVIALKLAQMQWIEALAETTPILLLDDVFDKLDLKRVERLLNLVNRGKAQVIITDTDNDRVINSLNKLKISQNHYIIENGKVK